MSLAVCLAALDDAADAASQLGLDVTRTRQMLAAARERLGFEGSTYVLALVGGTGVGKSSLLNALAGRSVSPASARRPTTSEPLAWVASEARSEVAPLLEWLGVSAVREHDGGEFREVAILDLPDLDSTTPEHRARVDALLPRIDAVAWVADPEKYRDAVLHDDYLRRWAPRLERQIVVLNKSDRIGEDASRVRRHLDESLRAEGLANVDVAITSAAQRGDIHELREWLAEGVEAKRVVAGRIAAEVRESVHELAQRGGVAGDPRPLLAPERRDRVLADVTRESAAIVDLEGLERQAVAATRLAARPRGAGPLGHLTAFVYRAIGRDRVAADPDGYLRRWRERGTLARPSEPIRELVTELVAAIPAESRPLVASLVDVEQLRPKIANAIDSAVLARAERRPPTSFVWNLIGLLQYAVTAGLIFAGLWIASVFLLHAPFASVEVPLLGPVPTPLVVLALLLLAGYILARLLGAHAGLLGRRWARRLRSDLTRELSVRLDDGVFAPLRSIDASRARIANARATIDRECGTVTES